MYTVKTPNKSFEGKRAGIQFVRGEATFEDAGLVSIFNELGYEVIEPVKATKPKAKAKAAKKGE